MLEEFSEGSARIVKEEDTFFNPAQKLNRDITAEVLKAYFKGKENFRILTAMSATGLRGIRYLNEIPQATIFFNDLCQRAVDSIQKNLKFNGYEDFKVFSENESLRESKEKINITRSDCHVLMHRFHSFFDVIDIDPFGSCAEFVNSAFKGVKHNGIICFTCTDKAALCSNEAKCYMKYNTVIKKVFCKNETPIRVLLSYISREFAKYDAKIIPLLSISVDFYVRVIVRVYKGQGKSVIKDNSNFGICQCLNTVQIPLFGKPDSICNLCKSKMTICGPFWNREIHDKNLLDTMIKSVNEKENERMLGILRLMKQEIPDMFYYEMPKLSSYLKVNCCKLKDVLTGLANSKYSVSLTHCDNNAFKTNASIEVVTKLILEIQTGVFTVFSLETNNEINELFEQNFYKGKIMSGLKPLALPKK
ncbi:tRNA methyltransferase 1 [Glugoides intestinalis]